MANKKHNISICIISRPNEDLTKCLNSLKRQTYKPKEIVIHREIGSFSKLRNKVIDKAHEEIIAFIDTDCVAEKHWLEEINNAFQDESLVGFYGKVCYDLGGRIPSISTRFVSNHPSAPLTSNAAFRSKIIKETRFDEEIDYLEDIILFKRVEKKGKILYSEDAIVFHDYQEWNFKKAVLYARKIEDFLKANKKYGIPISRIGPIINPQHYLILFFPPILIAFHSIRSLKDIKILIATYLEKIYTRALIWKYGLITGKFLL